MKYDIVKLLKDAAPGYVSGGELGRRFGVSRTAVWKYIGELRSEGYSIEACSRRGYRLQMVEDRLNSYEISDRLGTLIVGRAAEYFSTLDSTNNRAKMLAADGCIDGMTVLAGHQSSGRGRLGRNWESPSDRGIYISVVLRPPLAPTEIQILTLAAAVAVVRAISNTAGVTAGIKWPNDLVINGRKVCGILLEMSSEADNINYVVMGVGINYSQDTADFPPELRDRATSLKMAAEQLGTDKTSCSGAGDRPDSVNTAGGDDRRGPFRTYGRLELVRSILRELDLIYRMVLEGNHGEILELWRAHSVTLGNMVGFELKNVRYSGIAVDITADGKLIVDCSDGVRRELYSGEVSVRGIYGYT